MKAELVNLIRFKASYYKLFQELLVQQYGFYFSENRSEYFREILLKFLKKSPYDTYEDFYHYLKDTIPGKKLFQQLMEEVTIGETHFFRNIPQLEVFKEYVIPELVKYKRLHESNTIKIWSAGSSTGEEVYTNAFILWETLPVPLTWNIQILGTDVNRNVVQKALEGIYSPMRSQRHLEPIILEKYFDVFESGKFRVKNFIRKFVDFQHHNLIRDQYCLPAMIDVDVIFCRNVMIYFDRETTKKVVQNFYDTLRDGGFLFLGHSETLWQCSDKFKIIDFPKAFIYQKDTSWKGRGKEVDLPVSIPDLSLEPVSSSETHPSTAKNLFGLQSVPESKSKESLYETVDLDAYLKIDTLYHEGVLAYEKKDYDTALKCFDEIIQKDRNYLIASYAKATILSNQGKYKEAIGSLEYLIETDNLFLEAYYLKGILHMKLHENNKAIQTFQKVIYIHPQHALTYFHLANLYKDMGQVQQSRLSWNNLKKICQDHPKNQVVPMSDNLTYESLETIADKVLSDLSEMKK